jgi:small-conductance mechanosensitive channel
MFSQLFFSALVLLVLYFLTKLTHKFLRSVGIKKKVENKRIIYLEKFVSIFSIFIAIIVLSLIYSIDYKGLLVFASSFFAVVGVALFAQWSILSNITSSFVIFFYFPARIGDYIKIVDGDNSVEGEIVEISLFQVKIKDTEGNSILYPNSLILQKPVVKREKNETLV